MEKGKFIPPPAPQGGKTHRVLGEEETAITDAGIQKTMSDAAIRPDSLAHLLHVRSYRFADRSDGVDEGNLHRQECIGGVLDQLRAFGAGHDQWRRNPRPVRLWNRFRQSIVAPAGQRRIDLAQNRSAAFTIGAYDDSIGIKKIGNRRAFPQEFGIGSNIKRIRRGRVTQDDLANPVAGVNRDSTLFHDYLVAVDGAGYAARHGLYIRKICIALFSWRRTHGDKDGGTGSDRLLQIIGKIQLAASMTLQQLGQKVLVNRNLAGFEGSQLLLIIVYQDDVMTEVGEACSRDQPHIS